MTILFLGLPCGDPTQDQIISFVSRIPGHSVAPQTPRGWALGSKWDTCPPLFPPPSSQKWGHLSLHRQGQPGSSVWSQARAGERPTFLVRDRPRRTFGNRDTISAAPGMELGSPSKGRGAAHISFSPPLLIGRGGHLQIRKKGFLLWILPIFLFGWQNECPAKWTDCPDKQPDLEFSLEFNEELGPTNTFLHRCSWLPSGEEPSYDVEFLETSPLGRFPPEIPPGTWASSV